MASWLLINTDLYSSCERSISAISGHEVFFLSKMICAGTPNFLAITYTATQAPSESRSPKLWPMTKTLLESFMRFAYVLAITLVLTLVRFSTSSPLPPKNSKLSLFFMTAWSPPLERASSAAVFARLLSSSRESPPTPTPMLRLAVMPAGFVTLLTSSRILNFSSLTFS